MFKKRYSWLMLVELQPVPNCPATPNLLELSLLGMLMDRFRIDWIEWKKSDMVLKIKFEMSSDWISDFGSDIRCNNPHSFGFRSAVVTSDFGSYIRYNNLHPNAFGCGYGFLYDIWDIRNHIGSGYRFIMISKTQYSYLISYKYLHP